MAAKAIVTRYQQLIRAFKANIDTMRREFKETRKHAPSHKTFRGLTRQMLGIVQNYRVHELQLQERYRQATASNDYFTYFYTLWGIGKIENTNVAEYIASELPPDPHANAIVCGTFPIAFARDPRKLRVVPTHTYEYFVKEFARKMKMNRSAHFL